MAQKFSFETALTISLDEGSEHRFEVCIDYDYHKAVPAYTPRGEYAPIDPPEPATAEIIGARWRKEGSQGGFDECPGWLLVLIDNDMNLEGTLIRDAEEGEYSAQADYEPDIDERQEWRDYDPDC